MGPPLSLGKHIHSLQNSRGMKVWHCVINLFQWTHKNTNIVRIYGMLYNAVTHTCIAQWLNPIKHPYLFLLIYSGQSILISSNLLRCTVKYCVLQWAQGQQHNKAPYSIIPMLSPTQPALSSLWLCSPLNFCQTRFRLQRERDPWPFSFSASLYFT